ncbi:hypothetical protein [Streptomyces natalensis]|uniref:Membrane protein n=1 Tax=Streptomyces natalensis ATCC 27448 TaxID=1240678 RepID=A0A0D7CRT2_9ACTN|nr:hypothetical protein [Streptomyces natalensis]KIZ18954.1 membrane protein [Streptomyces natalensis ATCC 27448]
MPDDVGGMPFQDGEEPDEHHHGRADEEFASVVFDEEFVRSARIHEPSAVERMLAAAEARAEAEAARSGPGFGPEGADGPRERGAAARRTGDHDTCDDYGEYGEYGPYGPYGGSLRPYRGGPRWHRPIAWVLAVVMGIGLVALAFSAVSRGAAGRNESPAPRPASSEPATGETSSGGRAGGRTLRPGLVPSASAESAPPSASAAHRAH